MHPTELRRRKQRRNQAVQIIAAAEVIGKEGPDGFAGLDAVPTEPAAVLLEAIAAEATAGTNARVWEHAARLAEAVLKPTSSTSRHRAAGGVDKEPPAAAHRPSCLTLENDLATSGCGWWWSTIDDFARQRGPSVDPNVPGAPEWADWTSADPTQNGGLYRASRSARRSRCRFPPSGPLICLLRVRTTRFSR